MGVTSRRSGRRGSHGNRLVHPPLRVELLAGHIRQPAHGRSPVDTHDEADRVVIWVRDFTQVGVYQDIG